MMECRNDYYLKTDNISLRRQNVDRIQNNKDKLLMKKEEKNE